ncbi:Alginate-lyase domain-containing protein [Fusarium keratoplasticum]|nr:Alginate-lyase domain-containing protein [Fusarium keratoplasticum]
MTKLIIAILCLFAIAAEALTSNVPALNGPVISPQNLPGAKKRPGEFVHPGLWHTHDDLERIRNNVKSEKEPWKTAYKAFSTDKYSLSTYAMQGPKPVICRGPCSNYTSFTADTRAAWQNALMWYITKDQAHWDRATTILDAWGTNLTNIVGLDTSLLVGLEGSMLANAAEIMRWEGNWTEAGAKWQGGAGFSNQLYWLFARQSIIIGQANYGMVSIKALLDFAVYLDDVSMYNYALNAYLNDPCAGIYGNVDPSTGQSAEAGRDQSHAQSGVAWAAYAARTIQSQGHDVWSEGGDLLLKGSEYLAKYSLGNNVPYNRNFYRCEAILVNGPWSEISEKNRGVGLVDGKLTGSVWDIIYYAYKVARGRNAPWTTKAKQAYDKDGGQLYTSSADHPGWGDLIWSYEKGESTKSKKRTIWGGGKIGPNGNGNVNI